MGGLRPALANYGVTLGILENVETFGNLSGGVQQGFEANGLTTVTLQMDTGKAFGLKGGTLNASGLQYWGGNLTADNLMVLQTLTDIEAPVGVRLWELWYQQKFTDKFDIKIGEQSLDEEFTIAPTANVFFVSAMSGWPGRSNNRFARRRPRLSARGSRRSRTGAAHGQRHRARGRLQRQPHPAEFAERAGEQSAWRELSARHRNSGDRRTAIRIWLGRGGEAGERRPAAGRLQDRRLVRQHQVRRPAIRHNGRASRQSLEQRRPGRRVTATFRSMASWTR